MLSVPAASHPVSLCRCRGRLNVVGPLQSPPAGQRGRGGGSQGNAEVWAKLGWVAAGGFAGGGGGRDREGRRQRLGAPLGRAAGQP